MISVPGRVKDALREGNRLKNYRFNVLNDDGSVDFTIDNDTLVYESVKFDERMCSGDTLKFGLCEGSSLEFQYFDHENINGKRIQSFIDVQYKGTAWFEVITMQKDSADYVCTESGNYSFTGKAASYSCWIYIKRAGQTIETLYYPASATDVTNTYTCQVGDVFEFGSNYSSTSVDIQIYKEGLLWHTIPMGYFTVNKCSRQASTGIYKVTAYNKLQSKYLDQKVNDKIIEIASSGVIGATNGVDVGTILDELLEGYSIKREEFPLEYSVTSQTIPPSDTSAIRQTDASGTDNSYYIHTLDITDVIRPTNFDVSYFYRFRLNTKAFFDAVYSYVDTEFLDKWFKYSGYVDTLDNFLKGTTSFSQPLYVGGLQVNTSNGSLYISLQEQRNEPNYISPWFTNISSIALGITGLFEFDYNQTRTWSQTEIDEAKDRINDLLFNHGYFIIEASSRTDIERTMITAAQAATLSDVTLRDLQSAVFEINTQYGQIDRETDLFEGVDLSHSALYPAASLYPANNLYPGGVSESSFRSWYSKLWTDTVGEQSFRNLIITYKGLDGNNVPTDFVYETVVDPDGTTDYIMDDNWLFRNLIWTQADIESYAAAMVTKMQEIKWFPFEMWAAGLPYIETGDMIEIIVGDETHTSYVLQRQLSGIQNLQDTYINGTLDIF